MTAELNDYRSKLREQLLDGFTRKMGAKHTRFTRRGLTHEILEEKKLVKLSQLVLKGSVAPAQPSDSELALTIQGSKATPGFCNVLATLLHAKVRAGTLRTFLESLTAGKNRPYSNANLPLDKDTAREHFGIDDGSEFCPVMLTGKGESNYVGCKSRCPLRFCEGPKLLGSGVYGIVYEVNIEKGECNNWEVSLSHSYILRGPNLPRL